MSESKTGFDDPIGALTLDRFIDNEDFWYCQPSIQFRWDMWAACTIRCLHGSWSGEARGVHLSEAFDAALARYEAADHSVRGGL